MLGKIFTLAALVGVKLHDYLSGNNLVRDLYDEWRLASKGVESWHHFWQTNPCRSDIVICLTTTPTRIASLGRVLKSLLYQTRSPQRIRLHIPGFSKRENRAYEIPPFLEKLTAVEIVRCEDEGPATKLLPALRQLSPDQRILVVDDDKLYPADLVEHFHRYSLQHPDIAIGACGWVVPADRMDRPTTLLGLLRETPNAPLKCTRLGSPRQVDVLHGYAGYLVRPRFFDLDSVTDYSQAPPAAFFVDDVWISGHCKADKMVFPANRFCFHWLDSSLFYRSSLDLINNQCSPEQRNNTRMFQYFSEGWLLQRQPL